MSNQAQPGTYRARVVNYALSSTKAGNPQVEVLFEFSSGSEHHQIRYWGQLSEKALPYTLKNLVTMGYLGTTNEDFSKLADGVESGIMDLSTEVELVLESEPNDQGKSYLKVKWINAPGGGFKQGMTRDQAKVKLGTLNLAGQIAMIRQEIGVPAKPKQRFQNVSVAPQQEPMGDDFDDFDFSPV